MVGNYRVSYFIELQLFTVKVDNEKLGKLNVLSRKNQRKTLFNQSEREEIKYIEIIII